MPKPLSPQALQHQQFRALLHLQQRLLQRFWVKQGSIYRWSTALSYGFSALLACFLAIGIGFLIAIPGMRGVSDAVTPAPESLILWIWTFAFGVLGFMWTVSPLLFLMKNESLSLDLRKLMRFPIASEALHRFHSLLAFFEPWSIFFYPTCIAILWSSAYWPEVTLISRLCLIPLLALWVCVHTLGNRFLQDLMLTLFRSRYWKETLSLLLLFVVMFVSFAPAFVADQLATAPPLNMRAKNPEALLYSFPVWLKLETLINGFLYFSPPGLLVQGLQALRINAYSSWAQHTFSLSLWSGLIYFLSWKRLQQLLHEPEHLTRHVRQARHFIRLSLPLPSIVKIIALKDLRTYFRSLLGKLAFFLTPLMVILLRGAGLGNQGNTHYYGYVLSIIGYVFLTSMYLYINFFGHEGEGFKHYILSGAKPLFILLGKNLALLLFGCAQFSIINTLFALLYPNLALEVLIFGWLSFLSMALGVISLGNLLSIRTPGPMDLNQSHYRQNNGTPILLGFQVLMLLSSLQVVPIWLAWWHDQSILLLSSILALFSAVSWIIILRYAAAVFPQEAPHILQAITAKEAS
jgi:hypothetical protein